MIGTLNARQHDSDVTGAAVAEPCRFKHKRLRIRSEPAHEGGELGGADLKVSDLLSKHVFCAGKLPSCNDAARTREEVETQAQDEARKDRRGSNARPHYSVMNGDRMTRLDFRSTPTGDPLDRRRVDTEFCRS